MGLNTLRDFKIRYDPFRAPKRSCAHTAYSDKHSQVLEAPKLTLLGRLSRCQWNYGSPELTLSAPVRPGLQCQPLGPGTSSLPSADEKGDGGCRPIFQDWRQFSKQHMMETYYNKILESLMEKSKEMFIMGLFAIFLGPSSSGQKCGCESGQDLIAEGLCHTTSSACSI